MKQLYDMTGNIVPYATIEQRKAKRGHHEFEVLIIDLQLLLENIFDINQQFISTCNTDISKNIDKYSTRHLSILLDNNNYGKFEISCYKYNSSYYFGIKMSDLLLIIQNFKECRKYKTGKFSVIIGKPRIPNCTYIHGSNYIDKNNPENLSYEEEFCMDSYWGW